MAELEVRHLTARYGDVVALDRLDLRVATGEIFVLLGGSGSGKTTLLRCLGGFLTPTTGRLTLGGRDITALPPHRRPVNTMFQSYALFPHLNVSDNIAFGLRRQRIPRTERDRRVNQLLDLVRLTGFGPRRIDELSGGQQQRVALARSLAPGPDLLLLDEPLSALDRRLREETRADLVSILRQLGTTAIMVTHDQEEALATADRIGILDRGRLAQVGPSREVYDRPANRAVAEFLGPANVLRARVRDVAPDGIRLDLGRSGVVCAPAAPRAVGDVVWIAVRPERMRLVPDHRSNDCSLSGEVVDVAYRGALMDVVLHLPGGERLRITDSSTGAAPKPGEQVSAAWARHATVVLGE